MDILRFAIGLFATMTLGAMGLFLYLMKAPPTEVLNVHFLGEMLMVLAFIMFVLTYWCPSVYPPKQNTGEK